MFYSGIIAPAVNSTTHQCPLVNPYVITVKRDGVALLTYSNNAWGIIDYIGYRCGLNYVLPVSRLGANLEVMAPGTYEFRMSQPANGADVVTTMSIGACDAGMKQPMLTSYNSSLTDTFYTVSYSDWSTSINTYGYVNTGTAYGALKRNSLTNPWKRFFKDAPQIEHFYTRSQSESNYVTSLGWVYEKDEGHVYPSQLTGSLALTRLSKYDGYTGGLEHYYTTSSSDVTNYQNWGYTSDGVVAYVCAP